MLFPENLCNRSPGFSALVILEETPSPLPVGCPTDGLAKLPQEHSLVKTPHHGIVLLLAAEGGPALTESPFCLGIPHQTLMLAPLPEVHSPRYPCLDLMGPADIQNLCENDVGKDEGYLGVPAL